MNVTFIDTSILCELVDVPGMADRHDETVAELRDRADTGEQFVIPATAVIETGNHIANATGNRRAAAERFVNLLQAATTGRPPFRLWNQMWDSEFIQALCAGDSTAQSFVDLAGNRTMGAGDVAILVERDRFVEQTAFGRRDVGIWTLDENLGAYA